MTTSNLSPEEYNPYYGTYIAKAANLNLKEGLKSNHAITEAFLNAIPKDKLEYRYAEGKWTVKDIIQHIIDTERIFAYRALRVARNDKTALPGFEENDYALTGNANARTLESLLAEYKAVRQATIALFNSFSDEMLKHIGTASNSPISARAIGFIIIGHETHHCNVIKERYL